VVITDFEFKMTSPELGTKSLIASTAPLKDASGKITAAVVVIQDVTRMREIDRRKDEFIAMAAHELRNPLAALSGYSQLLQRMLEGTEVPPSMTRNVAQINKQITRLNSLVERLLDASRIELGRLVLNRSQCNLVEIAEYVVDSARATDGGEHEIELVPTGQEIVGEWDATRLEQVLTNLVGNALSYSPTGTKVQVRLEQRDGEARVEVVDRGPGVPPEERPALFNRYYQSAGAAGGDAEAENARLRRTRGLGLGLYISTEIVRAHGGNIGMRPNPEGGSIFWFTLPATA
jgi:two-component system phosphate regulon sensor histidine kinase PhoR